MLAVLVEKVMLGIPSGDGRVVMVEATVGPIHNAVRGLLVGNSHLLCRSVRRLAGSLVGLHPLARVPIKPQHLVTARVLCLTCGTALTVLVQAALGSIHSKALVKRALGPIYGEVLGRSPLPALPVEAVFGRLLGNVIGNQVGAAFDVSVKVELVNVAQCLTSRSGAVLAVTIEAALGWLLLARCSASWPLNFSSVHTRPQ